MSGLIGLLTGAFGGSLVGAVGGTAQKWIEGKNELKRMELANAHSLSMAEIENTQMQMQLDSTKAVAEISADVKLAEADASALVASFENDAATYSSVDTSDANPWLVVVDVVRGMVRPTITAGLTTYCVGVTAYNLYTYGEVMPSDQLAATTFALIEAMTTYAGLAISWWFGSRGHKAGGK